MKILTVVGARPQFIKAAVVSRQIASLFGAGCEILVHTGQHYDSNMSDIFFEELDIPRPHHRLGIGGGTHGENTGRMLEKLELLMQAENPDWVLVYGDTDSTLAGALAATKLHISVAHVEAGLRSFNRQMPEEVNRVLTDHLSSILFAPTKIAVEHLRREGIAGESVNLVGDVMYDAAMYYKKLAKCPKNDLIQAWGSEEFVLCTIHRAENADNLDRIKGIFSGLARSPWNVVLPIHPRTKARLIQMGLTVPRNVHVIEPVSYLEMVWLEMNCQLVITDSGGVQKEAYFHSRPCITMRDQTEWTELVDIGVNKLVGVDPDRISEALLTDWSKISFENINLYGSGDAGEKIINKLIMNR